MVVDIIRDRCLPIAKLFFTRAHDEQGEDMEKTKKLEAENTAAQKIQGTFRGIMARRSAKRVKHIRVEAAARIVHWCRCRILARRQQLAHVSAAKIQKDYRKVRAKRIFPCIPRLWQLIKHIPFLWHAYCYMYM